MTRLGNEVIPRGGEGGCRIFRGKLTGCMQVSILWVGACGGSWPGSLSTYLGRLPAASIYIQIYIYSILLSFLPTCGFHQSNSCQLGSSWSNRVVWPTAMRSYLGREWLQTAAAERVEHVCDSAAVMALILVHLLALTTNRQKVIMSWRPLHTAEVHSRPG